MATRHLTPARRKYNQWKISEARYALKLRAIEYKGGKCFECGYKKCIAALVFHHSSGSKEFQIGKTTRSWERVRKELDKTTLLCANCHQELHYEHSEKLRLARKETVRKLIPERVLLAEHGTSRGYVSGCKCSECVRWHTQKIRHYREKKRTMVT